MRGLAAVLLIAFFIVLTIFAIGSWSCDQIPKSNSETQQTENAKKKECTTFQGAFISGLGNTGNFIHAYHQETAAIATVVIAIFTIILGVFTVSLARATRLAAEHIPKIERAYVYIEPKWDFRSSNSVRFMYTFYNHGKTPAVIKSLDVRTEVSITPPDNTIHESNQTINDEYVLPAADHWGPRTKLCAYTDGDLPALRGRETFVWFYGSLKYEDVFGVERETRFRWKIKDWDKSRFHADGPKPYNERT